MLVGPTDYRLCGLQKYETKNAHHPIKSTRRKAIARTFKTAPVLLVADRCVNEWTVTAARGATVTSRASSIVLLNYHCLLNGIVLKSIVLFSNVTTKSDVL